VGGVGIVDGSECTVLESELLLGFAFDSVEGVVLLLMT
jgi:hypothetical protein